MQRNKGFMSVKQMCMVGMLAALMVVLQISGLGMINRGIIHLTLHCVVIVVGTMTCGLLGGTILSVVFGLLSFWTAITAPSAMVMVIVQHSILATFILCVIPRACIAPMTWLTYRLLRKANQHVSACVSAVVGSLTNTIFYLSCMLLIYLLLGEYYTGFVAALAGIVASNGIIEAVLAGVVSTPIVYAVNKLK